MTEPTVWMYGVDTPTTYHDTNCKCSHHCGNCFEHLANPRKRYCSDYCRNRVKRERALDRLLSSSGSKED